MSLWLFGLRTLLSLCLAVKCMKTNEKPHIIVIIGDDLGWNDFGYHGSNQIPTPNIDALGYNGVILDKFYTQQSCSPSRAALLTGNYPIRSGLQGSPLAAGEDRSLPLDMPTLPERLKELGYSTHLIGKWHLGHGKRKYTPTGRGFDTHFGYWNGWVGYFDYVIQQEMPNNMSDFVGLDLHDKFQPQWPSQGKYATQLFTEKSLEILEKHDKETPMFLMLAHLAGHTGKDGVELGVPDAEKANEKYSYISEPMRRRYADLVNIMDDSVGKVVKKLADKEMLENSIILFFSDNGAQTIGIYQNYASGWPLRGLKFTLFEGGVRGSAVLYSPLLEKKGYINKELMHISDWLPTFYSAAGGDVSNLGEIDGIDQWSTLSKNSTTKRHEVLLNIDEVEGLSALLGYDGRYKLVNGTYRNGIYDQYYGEDGRNEPNPPYNIDEVLRSDANIAIESLQNGSGLTKEKIKSTRKEADLSWCREQNNTPNFICKEFCLFDIQEDPCETKDILKENEDIAENMKRNLNRYFDEMVPQKNKGVDLKSNPSFFNNTWCTWLEKDKCERTTQISFDLKKMVTVP